ncbi:MAG: hypothetical protein HPKKFMNG_01332 [Planctomycetes bacterium]|nr:hypothetical protein [Planctomycetota bacterium]MCQ3950449.1 hypothetical protein [Planctomycetota bacterium]GIK53303.1 MAG: hypothetical protein BroJett014_22760 [Planctomycetota bacterium]HRJ79621.1 hypothetical protein [Planctomycetota bacterium]
MQDEITQPVGHVRNLLHQLNNDLSLILGHLDLAVHSAGGNEKLLKRLEASRAATQRMAEHVRESQKAIKRGS